MTGVIYPVVVAWTWGGGWLGDVGKDSKGFHDFAGCGIVHMVGGVAGFVGAMVIGPRYGKEKNRASRPDIKMDKSYAKIELFGNKREIDQYIDEVSGDSSFKSYSFPFVVYGTIILFVAWLWFNGGSTTSMF